MLDHTEFSVTIEEDDIQDLDKVLNLFKTLHAQDDHFYFKQSASNANTICLKTCSPRATSVSEHYPLDALIPLIQYKVSQLPQIDDPFISGDGSSIKAYLVNLDYHGLKITRKYLYAGK